MKKRNWFIFIPFLSVILVTSYYIFTTSSLVRYWTDDFCSAVTLRNHGYFDAQIFWWKGWTGRYSYIAFLDLVELFGQIGARILPIILFTLSIVTNLPLAFLSVLFLVNSPNVIQSFYWMTGSLNYFAPFVFLNFFLLLLFKENKKYFYILGFTLLFIATGFSEAFGIANFLFLSYLLFVLPKSINHRLLWVGLLATTLSLVFMSFAPGNLARSATVSHPENITELIKSTLTYSRWYLIHLLYIKTFVISILAIITGAFVFLNSKINYFKNPKLVLISSVIFIIATTLAVVGLTYQAMNWEPPERVMSIVNNMIILGICIFSVSLFQVTNKFTPKKLVRTIFITVMVLLINQIRLDWGHVRNEVSEYTTKWDEAEVLLKSNEPKKDVNLKNIQMIGKLDGFTDNKGWILGCISAYYGTGRIIVE